MAVVRTVLCGAVPPRPRPPNGAPMKTKTREIFSAPLGDGYLVTLSTGYCKMLRVVGVMKELFLRRSVYAAGGNLTFLASSVLTCGHAVLALFFVCYDAAGEVVSLREAMRRGRGSCCWLPLAIAAALFAGRRSFSVPSAPASRSASTVVRILVVGEFVNDDHGLLSETCRRRQDPRRRWRRCTVSRAVAKIGLSRPWVPSLWNQPCGDRDGDDETGAQLPGIRVRVEAGREGNGRARWCGPG